MTASQEHFRRSTHKRTSQRTAHASSGRVFTSAALAALRTQLEADTEPACYADSWVPCSLVHDVEHGESVINCQAACAATALAAPCFQWRPDPSGCQPPAGGSGWRCGPLPAAATMADSPAASLKPRGKPSRSPMPWRAHYDHRVTARSGSRIAAPTASYAATATWLEGASEGCKPGS